MGKVDRPEKERPKEELIPTASLHASIDAIGEQIGPYKLISILGEGGFGIVYLAQQEHPVRRRVALKLIKPGMDTKHVIARFEAERQALALLEHPNIAHVFDAGATKAGRPYFAMEYVKGSPITEYCDRERLSIEDRLKLFLQICDAIAHAHQKGIIHRDIKPSNILVSIEGKQVIPKVIDFGVAKAISQPLTERTLFTEQGQFVGTPAYMSPEQAEMTAQDIDTRTDIYSLGVLLYELLTGALPFDRETLRKAAFDEIRRMVREQEPPRPSTRLSSLGEQAEKVAQSRRTRVAALTKRLNKELEWIPLKAMRKERTRRYRSASELADDVQYYLNGAPLIAGPESATYRIKKFLRRHRSAVTLASLSLSLFFFAIAGLQWQGDRAQHAGWLRATKKYESRINEIRQAALVLRYVERELGKRFAGYKALTNHAPQDRDEFINSPLMLSGVEFLHQVNPRRPTKELKSLEAFGITKMASGTGLSILPVIESFRCIPPADERLPGEVLRAIDSGQVTEVADSINRSFSRDFPDGARALVAVVVDSMDQMDRFAESFEKSYERESLDDNIGTYINLDEETYEHQIGNLSNIRLFALRTELAGTMSTFFYGFHLDLWQLTLLYDVLPFAVVGLFCIVAAGVIRFVL